MYQVKSLFNPNHAVLSAPKSEVLEWLRIKGEKKIKVAPHIDPTLVPEVREALMARACLAYLGELGVKED